MTGLALWACLQGGRPPSVEELTFKASVIGLAEVQGISGASELRLRFEELWKGQAFGSFVLAAPEPFLRSGERVLVFAAAPDRGRHAVLGLYRAGDDPERHLRRNAERVPLREMKEKVFRRLGKELPPEDPPKKKKLLPPADAPPPPPPPPPPADPLDALLPWGFGAAALLIAAGAVGLWRQGSWA